MKLLVFFLLFFPYISYAACLGDIAFLRSKNLYINISDNDCATETITVANGVDKDGMPDQQSLKRYPLDEECSLSYKMDKISCHPNGHTPLAGAQYNIKHFGTYVRDCGELGKDERPLRRYVCETGCSKLVPKFLDTSDPCD